MTTQLDLFSSVMHAYAEHASPLTNKELYQRVAEVAKVPESVTQARSPVGAAGTCRNLYERKLRWYQQTLKATGILEQVPGQRAVWTLASKATKDISRIDSKTALLGFSTELGLAVLGSCETVFQSLDTPITFVITSPPYPLANARNYGNPPEHLYVDWLCKILEPVVKNLAPGGSICLNVSNDIFLPHSPARSLYRERLVLALFDRLGLYKMDELIWENRSKAPGPYQYASKDRTQLNVVWEPIYWLTNDPSKVRSDNRRVLQQHTEKHLKLIADGGENRTAVFSDGAYGVRVGSFGAQTEGRIPRNILSFGHRCKHQLAYKKFAREHGLAVHGAPMPLKLASFLTEFLTEPGELVVDPFGGSLTTAHAAELLGRRWLSTECIVEYLAGSSSRFETAPGFRRSDWVNEVLTESLAAKSGSYEGLLLA